MLLVQPITVRHFSDPGCPWAYSASPALATLRWRYGAQLDWKLTLIGLTERAQQYVDRGYTPEGTLVPRSQPGALLHDPAEVTARVLRLVSDGVVTAVDGSVVAVAAESACVHGDSPGAVEMARAVRAGLEEAGVTLQAFA